MDRVVPFDIGVDCDFDCDPADCNPLSMNVLLIGDLNAPPSYHVGDEAMAAANVHRLRRAFPKVDITVVSNNPDWSAQRYQCRAVRPIGFPAGRLSGDEARSRLLTKTLELVEKSATAGSHRSEPDALMVLRNSHALFISGGGNMNSLWPEHLFERVALIFAAKRLGKKILITGQCLGPELSPQHLDLLGLALRSADLVGVRDPLSFAVALRLGVCPPRLFLQPDDALLLPEEPPGGKWSGFDEKGPYVVVTPAPTLARGDTLADFAQQLIGVSRETGCRILLSPHLEEAEPDGHSDVNVAKSMYQLMRHHCSVSVCDVLPSEQVVWITARASLVVSLRYHPIVFAMGAAVPSLGIYSSYYTLVKLAGALNLAEFTGKTISVGACRNGSMFRLAMELWNLRVKIREQLVLKRTAWERAEDDKWQVLTDVLEGNNLATASLFSHASLRQVAKFCGETASHWAWDEFLKDSELAIHTQSLNAVIRARDEEIVNYRNAFEKLRTELDELRSAHGHPSSKDS